MSLRGCSRSKPPYSSLRLCLVLMVPLVTVILGRTILPRHAFSPSMWAGSENSPGFHDVPNHTSSQLATRVRRSTDNITSNAPRAIPSSGVFLFGVSFENDAEKRNVEFVDGLITILEGSTVNVRLYGVLAKGIKMKIAKSGSSCAADVASPDELPVI